MVEHIETDYEYPTPNDDWYLYLSLDEVVTCVLGCMEDLQPVKGGYIACREYTPIEEE